MAGSCENLAIIEKPLCSSVIEQNLSLKFSLPSVSDQRSCSEVAFSLFESKVDPTNALNGCLNLSKVNDTSCMSSGEVTDYVEAVTVDKDGLLAEGQNVSDMMLEKMPGSVCRISRECLNEIQSQDDACNLETGALCMEDRRSQGEYDHNTPLESLQMTVSLVNCVQPDKFDDKSARSLSPEGVEEVSDENSGVIVGLETDTRNQISSLQCCEVPLELITMTGLPSNYGQQQEQENIKSTGDLSLEVVDGKSDYSVGREADVHNLISPLEGGEMPLKVLHAGDLLSNYEQSDQKDDKIVHSLSEEQANRILQTKTNLDTCAHILTSQGCQRALENVHMSESLNIPAQKNEWQNGNDVDGTCAERISKLVEEKSDITTVTSVEPSAANVAHNYTFEKSVSPESCQHFSIANSNTSKDMPDENIITSINSSSVAECSEHTDNEEKDNVGVGCVYEIKCPEIVSSSSRSNGRRSKSSQKTSQKRAEKKCKNTTHVLHSHGSIRIVSKAARMKRSSFSKPARSSIWGSLDNITQFFEQSNGIYRVSQVQNQGGRKARGGRRSGKQAKIRASGSSRGSRGNHCVSSGCVRLKVKIGKVAGQSCLNNMDPKFVDASASANTTTSDCGTDLFSAAGLELLKFDNGVEDSSREDGQLTNKDTENTNNIGKAAGDADDYLGVPSNVVVDTLGGAIENRCTDSGTSPDSEVINLTPDNQVSAIQQTDFNDALLTSSKDVSARGHHASTKRGKKNKLPRSRNCILKDGSPDPVSISKAKPSKKQGCIPLVGDGICSREILTSLTNVNSSSNSSSNKELPMEPLVFSRETEHGILRETLKGESSVEAKTYSNLCADVELSESHNSKILHPSMKAMGRKHPKSGKVSKGRSKASESEGKRGNSRRQKREKQSRSVNKCKVKEKDACNQIMHKVESHPETGSHDVDGIEKTNADDSTAVTDESNLNMVPGGLENQYPPPRKAWVLCDECHKWRRIPAMLADLIDKTNCTWTCKENMDIAFADCSIPQEKSNAEINVELDISDASGEEDVNDARLNYKASECKRSTGYQESTFKCTSNNEFLHRKRKTQTIDEIMVCHCKPASNDQLGCGDECLNRMLNIECVQGTCPCGDLCSNQQFQKQKYAKLEWFRSGKKGYGLKLLEDISKGHFLIEYVGEVLDMHAYEARQKEYALKGHRHFYFMTLNGSEVIDACAKGNLGRFINHSCDPNCRTEKWMVNGEICIGLFALRDIKKGEEVTFDYNYVRVFGAAAKKCYCGAPQCRGYIGGDLLNSEVIVQGDSDEEFPEPVMLLKDGGRGGSVNDMMPTARSFGRAKIQTAKSTLKSRHGIDKCTTGGRHLESTIGKEDPINQSAASYLHSLLELEDSKSRLPSLEVEISHQTDDVTSKSLPAVRQETSIEEETTNKTSSNANRLETVSPTLAHSKSLSDVTNASMNSKSDTVEDKRVSSKSQSQMRVSRSSSSVKKGKASCNPLNTSKVQVTANKSQSLLSKPKRSLASSPNGRSEAVEEKLNELLDTEGGVSKRKDATKGYLKLLFLTAASGDSGNGEAIQSNRDLSMILDALLKTKSRTVLIDIINKNGLQMLHNIMKQYRRDFKKIPILRKLLKVLEYLAVREILTAEHINGGPPCPGKESFRESILSLTEHDDKQVHQIARNFRDRWIPRPVRKLSYVDRDDGRMEIRRGSNCDRFSLSHNYWRDQEHARPTEAIDCVKQSMVAMASYDTGIPEGCSAPCIGSCLTSETKTRKRKSRWDQPAETNQDTRSQHKEQKIDCTSPHKIESGTLQRGVEEAQDPIDMVRRKRGNCAGPVHNHSQQDGAISADDERQNIPEDIPPGFSSPQALGLSHASSAATDLPQHNVCDTKRPLDAIIGQPQGKFISRLPVSYGVPLSIIQHFGTPQAESINGWFIAPGMPFHPFPPLPPYPWDSKNCPPSHAPNPMTINQPAEGRRDSHCRAPCHMDETPKYLDGPCANSNQPYKRARESSYDLGRRYFRQEKWNATKVRPPSLGKRNAWGHMGDNSRGVSCSIGIGKVENEATSSYLSEELSCRVEKAGNNFFQHFQHQNHN